MRIPVSTYRLQFNRDFGFQQTRDIMQYINELGISDIYASPIFKARKGSHHGYDIVDANSLNHEIGSEDDFNSLYDDLLRHGMGLIQDIVPNHMCITSSENKWWMDVLENGLSSTYSDFFDIDWEPVKKELKDKILLPFLGDQYGNVLQNQELRLTFEDGAFFIRYYDFMFPLRPKTYAFILGHGIDVLKKILPQDDPHFVELLSVITALNHLPLHIETDTEKVSERYREKEIIKKRLGNLYRESRKVRDFIDKNLHTFNGIKGDSKSLALLDNLLRKQVYRLAHWRVAAEEINYRRFFDINDLAAIRMEDFRVFNETHELILKLIQEKKITGLRVDHPDGLYNPCEYFQKLQKSCHPDSPIYIVGEKILTKGEKMLEDWPISGTTGYSFMNASNGVFIDTGNAKLFDSIYTKFIRQKLNYQDVVYEKKKLIMHASMASELNTLSHFLNRISEKDMHTRDYTLYSLTTAIKEVISCFPIYRTYINSFTVQDHDRKYIDLAVSKAKRKNPAVSESVFDFLRNVLLLNFPEYFEEQDKKEWLDFVMRFQQITGPVMAKGLEDTTFYVYNRLISLNEVGGDPERFGLSVEAFHGQNIDRNRSWPNGLIATSTHDSKRSEDVRARINVLSEIPDEWRLNLMKWGRLNRKKKIIIEGQTIPDRNEEYFLYQTLIGVWPFNIENDSAYTIFVKRIQDHMIKSIREAKANTSWINTNSEYEEAVIKFTERILSNDTGNQFLNEFRKFQKKISHYGMHNSLSQTLLKITSPGVPDFYQGTELWDFSLVDPDNRQPVDYSLRRWLFFEMKDKIDKDLNKLIDELLSTKEDGRIKMFLIYSALAERQKHRELFEQGNYIPLETKGKFMKNIVAFAREYQNSWAVTVIPRLLTQVIREEEYPLGEDVWLDTHVILPDNSPQEWLNVITFKKIKLNRRVSIGEALKHFAVALLVSAT